MKSKLGRKILFIIFIPFLIIFGTLSAYISGTLFQYVTNWTELEIKGISEINAADLKGRIESVKISVLSTAEILSKIDTEASDARRRAEDSIKSMFINGAVYNVWLAYEPQAFDGKDELHQGEYPGAPSGRFISSYIVEDNEIVLAPDMDEGTIDDPAESPWYTRPRDTGRLYVDIDNEIPNLYDYGVGEDPVHTLSVTAPIVNDGEVIGCVGADVLFDNMTFSIDDKNQAIVAVFYPNGRIFYAPDIRYAEETIDTLGFTNAEAIKEAISRGESLFLPDEYCFFADTQAFQYFHPLDKEQKDTGSLYMYVAIPRSVALQELFPVYIMIGGVTLSILLVLLALFWYVAKSITKPIINLTLAADAISQGNLETEIAYFSDSKNEIGILSRSLHRMVEQFRVYITSMEQTQAEMAARAQLEDFTRRFAAEDEAFIALTGIFSDYFPVYKASYIKLSTGKASVIASCRIEDGVTETLGSYDFMYNTHAQALISGKRLVFLNTSAIMSQNVEFIGPETVSACLLPLYNDSLAGYIILENNDAKNTLNAGTESILIYISEMLSRWLCQEKEDAMGEEVQWTQEPELNGQVGQQDEKVPENDRTILFGTIEGLDAGTVIEAMGGMYELYEQSVMLTVKVIPRTIEKLDKCLADEDLKLFAIEIHGVKGVLNNIGAFALGLEALSIEKAAGTGDIGFCRLNYPAFKEKLTLFLKSVREVIEQFAADGKEQGDATSLGTALDMAREAAEKFDSVEAFDVISPFLSFSYDEKTDALLKEIAEALEVFDCERALGNISLLRENSQI